MENKENRNNKFIDAQHGSQHKNTTKMHIKKQNEKHNLIKCYGTIIIDYNIEHAYSLV